MDNPETDSAHGPVADAKERCSAGCIAERAYAIWLERGRPEGCDLQHWLDAESELLARRTIPMHAPTDVLASEAFWRILVQTTTDYITWLQRDGTIAFVNHLPAGLLPADVIGTSVYQLLPIEQQEPFRQALDTVFRTSEPWSGEVAAILPRLDELHWYATRMGPVTTNGQVIAVTCISTDITERKRADRLIAAEHAVTRILAQSAELVDAAPGILRAICASLDWDVGAVWKLDRPAQVLRCVDVWHAANIEVPAFERTSRERTFSKGIGLPGRVWANERPAWIPDVTSEDNFPRAPVAAADGLHGAFAFPIRSGVEFLGVVEFFSRSIQEPDEKLLEMMTMIGGQISQFIEWRTADRMVHEREREFALARQIQLGLLPRAVPVVPGYAFGGAARFRQETGGDYYDLFPLGEPGVGIAVGDASGHGIAAALIISATCTALRTLALTHRDPGEILAVVNQLLIEELVTDHFVTFFLARIDPKNHSLAYSSAGHCIGYILQRDGKVRLTLPPTGMPLGIEPRAKFPQAPAVTLQPDELVLVVTDGVLEARSPDEVPFGVERALHVVATHFEETPTKICQALLAAVQDFCPPEGPFDDATAAIIKRAPAG